MSGNGYDYPSVQSSGASIVQVETLGKSGAFILWFAAFLSALAIMMAGWSIYATSLHEREVRVYQDMVLRYHAALSAQGLIPEEEEH